MGRARGVLLWVGCVTGGCAASATDDTRGLDRAAASTDTGATEPADAGPAETGARPAKTIRPALEGEIEPCGTPGELRRCPLTASSPCAVPDGGSLAEGLERCGGQDGGAIWGPCECALAVPITSSGKDCVSVTCPAFAPNPMGCDVTFIGSDTRGCVARTSDPATLYMKLGTSCSAGDVGGVLYCSARPGAPLDPTTCRTNKTPYFVGTPSDCPH